MRCPKRLRAILNAIENRHSYSVECPFCSGSGKIKKSAQTNEEWFCTLNTEQKAEWLEDKMTWAAQEQGTFTAKGWEKWLKEVHK